MALAWNGEVMEVIEPPLSVTGGGDSLPQGVHSSKMEAFVSPHVAIRVVYQCSFELIICQI